MKTDLEKRNERIYVEYHALIDAGSPKQQAKHLFMCRYNLTSINAITAAIQSHERKIKA